MSTVATITLQQPSTGKDVGPMMATLRLRGDEDSTKEAPVKPSVQIKSKFSSEAKEVSQTIASHSLLGEDADARAARAKYPAYLPVWEHSKFPPWEEIPYVDAGTRATIDKRHLLGPGVTRKAITPPFGEELRGVQLSKLSKEALDDLALLAGERGVLVFRDQDFKDIGPEAQLDLVRHFGRLHIHPTMGHPVGYPEMHVVYRDPQDTTQKRYILPGELERFTSTDWHLDHSSEIQPPGMTFFWNLETPEAGGDTCFVSLTEAYKKMSPEFQERMIGLKLVHDNHWMVENSRRNNGPVRFEPKRYEYPLVRTHPATGEKYLWFAPRGFCTGFADLKQEESDYLFRFLGDLLAKSNDIQLRIHYEPGTVVVWDNRVVAHTALYDFRGDERRHNVRIAAMSDVPKGP